MVDFESDIQSCLSVLNRRGLILYPTDTIWGIGCDAGNAKAVEKIFQLKRRPDSKSMIVLVADERDILKHVAAVDLALFDYLKKETRPTTVVYEGAIGLAPNLIASDGTIGIRICGDDFCKHLVKRFRKPIVSTSANLSGEPSPSTFKEIRPEIINGVDYAVHYRRDDTAIAHPSKIIRWNKDSSITVIRP
jgi:L-threonylcarbamoyladenylate synthase